MSTRLVLISDTHLPTRAKRLPDSLWDAIEEADVVVHAGDWVEHSLYAELRERARHLVAVFGNNDDDALRRQLPEIASETIEGIRLSVIHETGARIGREARCDARFPDTDLLVFGHSHIPWDSLTPRGMRLLNPGSPTDRRRQPTHTYLRVTAGSGTLHNALLVALEPPPR